MYTEAAQGRSRRRATRAWGAAIFTLAAALPATARAEPPQGAGAATKDAGPLRRALLIEHLKHPAERAPVERYAPAVVGTITLATAVGVAVADFNEGTPRQRWMSVGLLGGLAGLSFSSYAVPERAFMPVFGSVGPVALAGLGAVFYDSEHATSALRFTFGSMIATGAVWEGLLVLDAALKPSVSGRRSERHLERLQRSGSPVSAAELREIEAELALTDRPIPLWVTPLVLMGGALAAAAPALSQSTTKDDRQVCLVFSSFVMSAASGAMVGALINEGRGYRAYREALHGVGLTPLGPAGSAGLTLTGRF